MAVSTARPDTAWQDQAACRYVDPELFFPDRNTNSNQAKQICRACPVCELCLREALWRDTHEGVLYGIWGGLSVTERYRLRKAAR